jgi:hypothetical protein
MGDSIRRGAGAVALILAAVGLGHWGTSEAAAADRAPSEGAYVTGCSYSVVIARNDLRNAVSVVAVNTTTTTRDALTPPSGVVPVHDPLTVNWSPRTPGVYVVRAVASNEVPVEIRVTVKPGGDCHSA